jgi:hypothetical protein
MIWNFLKRVDRPLNDQKKRERGSCNISVDKAE